MVPTGDWKNGKPFSSRGKVRKFCQDWKGQGILPKILEKLEKFVLENSGKFVSQQ